MNAHQDRRVVTPIARIMLLAALSASLAACDRISSWWQGAPDIRFLEYDTIYSKKPDFALVEHRFPLAPEDLAKLTPKNLEKFDQEQIDQIYARLTAGPIPDGAFDGGLFFPKGQSGDRRLAEVVGGLGGRVVNFKAMKVEDLGATLWKGKVFERNNRLLRNRIEDLALLKPFISGDLSDIEKHQVNGRDQWLLFPARLYCGQSLLDSRRESIVIDYFFTDELPGYRAHPDFLAGRTGLQIRDEIRMVRPGFYLGRAYSHRAFLLNFTLYNAAIAEGEGPASAQSGQVKEDCWPGTQKNRAVLTAAR